MNTEVYNKLHREISDYFCGGGILFEKINQDYYNSLLKERKVYIWGTGETTQDLLKRIPTLKIRAFIDSYKKIDLFKIQNKEYPVILPAEIGENVFCIIASIYYEEIKETLEKMGKVEGIDFLSYRVLLPTPAEMIKQMLDSDRVTKWECEYHRNTKRLQRDGSLGFCMNTPWLNPPNGNIFLQSYDEICNSIRNKLINISIEEGIYCFCDKNRCNPLRENIEKKEVHNRSNVNKEVNCAIAAFDRTCNLHCESCRNETIIQNNLKIEYMKKFFIQELLPTSDIINCAGEGEALYSNAYMNIFEACRNKNKKIIVLSNGTLASREMIDNLVDISNGKIVFSISIDAAKKETYERLRRGANFEILLSNMQYIGDLVKQRKIRALGLNFVISKKNCDEIFDFIDMSKKLGVSALNFTLLGNWGTFSKEEYDLIRVTDDEFNPIPEIEEYMNEMIQKNTDIKIYFRQEYDYRNYLNKRLENNM